MTLNDFILKHAEELGVRRMKDGAILANHICETWHLTPSDDVSKIKEQLLMRFRITN